MTIRVLRRDKDDKSRVIDTNLYGPLGNAENNPNAVAIELKFQDTKITEVEPGGLPNTLIRSIASVDLIPGAKYLLSWKMWGQLDAPVEFLLDQQDIQDGAHFKSIAKDKIPAPGNDASHSRQTPSGLVWINAKHIWG